MALSKLDFLVESLKNIKKSGTFTQSSPSLCKKMVEHIDGENDKVIIELGAGDGAITKYILDKMAPDARLFSFEINENLFEQLSSINDQRLIPILDSAENISTYLKQYQIKEVDIVLSAIPLVMLPTELSILILNASKNALKKGGLYIQFNYSKMLKDLYKSIFHNYRTQYILLNAPPAYVFICEKRR